MTAENEEELPSVVPEDKDHPLIGKTLLGGGQPGQDKKTPRSK